MQELNSQERGTRPLAMSRFYMLPVERVGDRSPNPRGVLEYDHVKHRLIALSSCFFWTKVCLVADITSTKIGKFERDLF